MVCADAEIAPDEVLDIVSDLAGKSLVVMEGSETVAWYRLLEPVGQYALELLEACGEESEVRSRHASYYLELAEQAAAGLRDLNNGNGAPISTWNEGIYVRR